MLLVTVWFRLLVFFQQTDCPALIVTLLAAKLGELVAVTFAAAPLDPQSWLASVVELPQPATMQATAAGLKASA